MHPPAHRPRPPIQYPTAITPGTKRIPSPTTLLTQKRSHPVRLAPQPWPSLPLSLSLSPPHHGAPEGPEGGTSEESMPGRREDSQMQCHTWCPRDPSPTHIHAPACLAARRGKAAPRAAPRPERLEVGVQRHAIRASARTASAPGLHDPDEAPAWASALALTPSRLQRPWPPLGNPNRTRTRTPTPTPGGSHAGT